MRRAARAGAAAGVMALALAAAAAARAQQPPRITGAALSAPPDASGRQQDVQLSLTEKPVPGHSTSYAVTASGTVTYTVNYSCLDGQGLWAGASRSTASAVLQLQPPLRNCGPEGS